MVFIHLCLISILKDYLKKLEESIKAFLVSRYHINRHFMKNLDVNKYHYIWVCCRSITKTKIGKSYMETSSLVKKFQFLLVQKDFLKTYNLSVVFADITRTKRGHYKTKFIEIFRTTKR